MKWLIALGVAVLLTIVGVLLVQSMRVEMITTQPTPSAEETVDPAEIPEDTSVGVLDATSTEGRASAVAENLEGAGWVTGVTGSAASPYDTTTVFYSSPEYAGAAAAVAEELGVTETSETSVDLSGSPVTVIVGSDADDLGL